MQPLHREILPSTTSRRPEQPTWSENKRQEESRNGRRKNKSVKIACQSCKRRRVKCDGQRPECARCANRKDICRYDFDAPQDTTRYQALHKKHTELEHILKHHLELLELLRQRPYLEAIAMLEHIRKGASAGDVLKLVEAGEERLRVVPSQTIDVPPAEVRPRSMF